MLRNTAIAICLLAGCASLASYWVSQRQVLAGERPPLGWIGLAIGTALLLFAAIIALTTTWVDSIESAPTADLRLPVVGQPLANALPGARPIATEENPMSRGSQYARASIDVPPTTPETGTDARSAAPHVTRSTSSMASTRIARSPGPLAPMSGYLWGATRCVFAFRQDPTEDRWTLDNDCGVPVGIMVATCADEQARCAGGWRIVNEGTLLPGKPQRSVSLREQTLRGARIRYIACAIADPGTIALMAIDPPATPTSARREALDAAAQNDVCVGAVRGGSIDQLFGSGVPLSPHEALLRQ